MPWAARRSRRCPWSPRRARALARWPQKRKSGSLPSRGERLTEFAAAASRKALEQLHPAISHPDQPGPLVPYGSSFKAGERVEIREFDVPAGLPDWMRSPKPWADRVGTSASAKRRNITITIPPGVV